MSKAKFNKTNDNIGWAAWSWNPVTGCKAGCDYCYARKMAERFHQSFEPTFHPERLEAPQNTKIVTGINTRVFVSSMGELFGPWVLDEWINEVLDVVRVNPQWTFLFLTKFPKRLYRIGWPTNAWIGATIDRQERVQETVNTFLELKKSRIRNKLFISCEPLLEKIRIPMLRWLNIDWLIMGALSKGKQKIQPKADWVEYLFNQARLYGVPVWMKDNLIFRLQEVPDD